MVQTKEEVKTWLADNSFEAYVQVSPVALHMHEGNYNYLIKCFVLRALYSKALWIMVFDFICSPWVVVSTQESTQQSQGGHMPRFCFTRCSCSVYCCTHAISLLGL